MVSIVIFCVLNEFIICYWIFGLLFSDNITGHQSLYINFGVFLLIFESCDQLGEGWMLCRYELIEAAIPCLQRIVRTRFSAEHPIENVPIGNVKLWFDASISSTSTNIGVFEVVW